MRGKWATSVRTIADFVLALCGFLVLIVFRTPPLVVVIITALGGVVLGILALLIS